MGWSNARANWSAVTIGLGKGDDPGRGHRQFVAVDDRLQHLVLEGGGAAIPEEAPPPGAIEQGWNVARPERAAHSSAEALTIGERARRIVAADTRARGIAREAPVLEQTAAQINLFRRQRIVFRDGPVQIQSSKAR